MEFGTGGCREGWRRNDEGVEKETERGETGDDAGGDSVDEEVVGKSMAEKNEESGLKVTSSKWGFVIFGLVRLVLTSEGRRAGQVGLKRKSQVRDACGEG